MKTNEAYLPGYDSRVTDFMALRTAPSHAAFVLPKLRPGLRLLDIGCGPGTITLDLARLVAPGEAAGLDRENSQIEKARESAKRRGVTNVRFDVGSIYELPFADAAFDVVFAHAVFEHLREPLAALSEIHRVLTKGGLVALRSPDWGGYLVWPATPQLDAALIYYQTLQTQRGGDVQVGRKFKTLLRRAGFCDRQFSASFECYESLDLIGEYLARGIEASIDGSANSSKRQQIEGFADALRNWYRSEDGVFAQSWCEIIGYK